MSDKQSDSLLLDKNKTRNHLIVGIDMTVRETGQITFIYIVTGTYIRLLGSTRSNIPVWNRKWTSDNEASEMRAQRRFWSTSPFAQSDQNLHCMPFGKLRTQVSPCGQRILWSDGADAQADLSLRWAHMSEDTFYHVVAQTINGVWVNWMDSVSSMIWAFTAKQSTSCNLCHQYMLATWSFRYISL